MHVEERRLAGAVGTQQAGDAGAEGEEMSLTATTLPYQRETSWSSDGGGRGRAPVRGWAAGRAPAGRRGSPGGHASILR